MVEGLKNAGGLILGIGGFLFIILVSVMMIKGTVWIGEHVMQWLINLTWLVFFINLFILLPLSLFRKTGIFGGIGMFISSYLFGLTLWFLALLLTYFTWGFIGVIVGLVLGGVGIVPVGMLAMLINAEFSSLFILILLAILTFGTKFLGIYLAGRAEEMNDLHQRQKHVVHEQ